MSLTGSNGRGRARRLKFLLYVHAKVDFYINGDQFFFFLEKLRRDIDLNLLVS